jgi:ERCC4-type nuclease
MIIADRRVGSAELVPLIRKVGVLSEVGDLPFGDFTFDGRGPAGDLCIGVERKTLHDMLACIDDARYSAHQLPGMKSLYDVSYLIVEGSWRPQESGLLMELFRGTTWGYCKQGPSRIMYHKLRRYLFSVSLAGVNVIYTSSPFHTAYDLCELFHYYQKPWDQHTAMIEMQSICIPTLNGKPSLVRRWAHELAGIGTKQSEEISRVFKLPGDMAIATEAEWKEIDGIGPKKAKSIWREIWG